MIHLAGKGITTDSDKISRFQKPEVQESPHSRVSATKDGLGTKNLVLTQFRAKRPVSNVLLPFLFTIVACVPLQRN